MAAKREAREASNARSLATGKRGRLSERSWADVRRAARIAREEGVALKVHGIEVTGKLKQLSGAKNVARKVLQKPAEPAAPAQPSAVSDEASPPPLSKRQQRSAQRLQEYQEQKRGAAVAELVAKGCELSIAQATVARLERKRLEERAKAGAAPMEGDAASVDGRPAGEDGQPRGEDARQKRARASPPEAG